MFRRQDRSEEHTSELQSHVNLVCRLLPEKKNTTSILRRSASVSAAADWPARSRRFGRKRRSACSSAPTATPSSKPEFGGFPKMDGRPADNRGQNCPR